MTEAAKKRAEGSSRGEWSIEAKGQVKQLFSNIPKYDWSAQVQRTSGRPADGLKLFIRSLSFMTCASFPSSLIFFLENLFRLLILSETVKFSNQSTK